MQYHERESMHTQQRERPNKKICVVQVTAREKLGQVGRIFFFSFFL